MAEQTVVGPEVFTEQPQRDRYTPGDGLITTRRWLGPRSQYDAKLQELIATEPDTLDGEKGKPAELVATYLPQDAAIDQAIWELIPVPQDRP